MKSGDLMANKENGAVKLTSLEFDISKIFQQMRELQEKLPELSKAIGEQCASQFETGFQDIVQNIDTTSISKIGESFGSAFDDDKIRAATASLKELATQYSELAKIAVEYNSTHKTLSGSITYDDRQGDKIVEQFQYINDEWKKTTTKQIDDIQKREQVEKKSIETIRKQEELAWKQYEKEERQKAKLKEETRKAYDEYFRQLEKEENEIAKISRQQIAADTLEQARKEKAIVQIDELIAKYQKLSGQVSIYRNSETNIEIGENIQQDIKELNELSEKLKDNKLSATAAGDSIVEYTSRLKTMSASVDKTKTLVDGMIDAIGDKARWLIAFHIVDTLSKSFGKAFDVIKQTEDAVIELQRVLNDPELENTTLSSELYDIATQYGRTFDEVQETAVKFAQAGYEWNDVVALTKSTMLALNTAELDVSQSTEGLIAVMSQWKIEATDMERLIDKINITADNYAVTSEKIVTALQRASGAAKNANISIEETIGAITALSVATGRSGENIGTALNSLISYTSKAENLEVFAGLSDELNETVRKYRAGALSIYDVWLELADEIENLTQQQQNTLAENLAMDKAYNDFAEQLESEAAELTDNINNVYKTAGTFRRNYFIALLNEISTSQSAIENMTGSIGYSAAENEKYMDSLTAKLNQLKAAVQELAVQIGDSGILNVAKIIIGLATSVVQLTHDLGGLNLVLLGLFTKFVKASWEKQLERASNKIDRVKSSLTSLSNALFTTSGRAKLVNSAFGSIQSGLLTVYNAVMAVYMAWNYYNVKMSEARENALATIETNSDLIKSYEDYITQINNEVTSTTEIANILGNINKSYADEMKSIDDINEARKRGIEIIQDEAKAIAQKTIAETASERKKAEKYLSKTAGVDYDTSTGTYAFYGTATERMDYLQKKIGELIDLENEQGYLTVSQEKRLTALSKEYTEIAEDAEYYTKILEEHQTALSILNGTYWETVEVGEEVESTYNLLAVSTQYITSLSEAMELLNDGIDDLQSNLNTAYNAYNEFNEQGYLSIDTIQELLNLNYEYFNTLQITQNGISLNNEALQELINSQEKNLENEINLAKEKAALTIIQNYLTEAQKQNASVTTAQAHTIDTATASLGELVNAAANATISLGELNRVLSKDEQFKGVDTNAMFAEIKSVWNSYDNLLKQSKGSTTAWASGASTAMKNATSNLKTQLERQKDAIKDRYDTEIEKLKELQDEYEKRQKLRDLDKEIAEAESRSGVEYREKEAELKQEKADELFNQNIEAQIAELERLRDAEIAAIEAQIDKIGNATYTVMNNAVAYNSEATTKMYDDYKENYVEPMADETSKTYTLAFSMMSRVFDDENNQMLQTAKNNATQIYDVYNNNFFSKFKQNLYEIKLAMLGMDAAVELYNPYRANRADLVGTTNNYNNTSTSNTSAYININGNGLKGRSFSLFTMK